MSFANPWAVWLGAAAVPLVVAFLIRRYRRRQMVSSVAIYRRMAGMSTVRRRFATPQHLVALLLSLLAMAALAVAIAQPEPESIEPRQYILVLDTSASMSAVEADNESSRLERAAQEIHDFSDGLNPEDQIALVTAGMEAAVAVGWTTDHRQVVDALAEISPLGAGGAMDEAFRIADAMCQLPQHTEVVLVSDGAGVRVPSIDCPLRYVRIGDAADNLAITGFTVREADALGLNEVYLAVHNATETDREVSVDLDLDGFLFDVASIEVPANTTVEQLRRFPLPPGDVLRARISDREGNTLDDDDVAYAVLKPGARVQSILITDHPTTFLTEALTLHPRVDLTVVAPSAVDPTSGPFDLLVIDSPYPGELPTAVHLMVLDVEQERFALNTSGSVRQPPIIRWSFDDPLFRFVNLDGLHLATATATTLPETARTLADMPDGPLIFSMDVGDREGLFFTFHPDRSDLPLRVAFVNLVANIVEWAQPLDGMEYSTNVATGERLAPEGGSSVEVRALVSEAVIDGRLDSSEPIPAAGVYRLTTDDGVSRGLVAANLFSASEANLTPAQRLGAGAAYGWPEVFTAEAFPWWILAVAAIGLLLLEWVLPALIGLSENRRQRQRLAKASSRGSKSTVPTANPRTAAAAE